MKIYPEKKEERRRKKKQVVDFFHRKMCARDETTRWGVGNIFISKQSFLRIVGRFLTAIVDFYCL